MPVSDAAGEIVECGSGVDLWQTGDKVCTVVFQGHDQVSRVCNVLYTLRSQISL